MKKKLLLAALTTIYVTGCNTGTSEPVPSTPPESSVDLHDDHNHDDHDAHDHADHGPHEGELIELGKGAYHIEFTHNDGGVVFYILGENVTDAVAIDAEKLTVSLKQDDQVKSFELDAEPQDGDGDGKSSRFSSSDPELAKWMNGEAEGAVTLNIDGKSLTGNIAHDHDHDHAH